MKKLGIGLLVMIFVMNFGSCTTEELVVPQENLLKSYKLKKDAEGHYSIEYNVADKTSATIQKDFNSLTNEIYLTENNQATKKNYITDFSLENDNKLRVGFIDENSGRKPMITVDDENITFGRGIESTTLLKTYSVESNGDGTVQLDFEVNNGVNVWFVYNDELEIYEVHLKRGYQIGTNFSRTISFGERGILKIDFVNHLNAHGRSTADAEYIEKKPRLILNEEGGNS
mgnify:CR=1 FL=1